MASVLRRRNQIRPLVAVAAAVTALALGACAGSWRAGGASPSPTAVVPASAAADDTYTCAGIPDSSIQALLGPDLRVRPRYRATAVADATCWIEAAGSGGRLVVYTDFITPDDQNLWFGHDAATGDTTSTFSFPGTEGTGEAKVDTGVTRDPPLYASTLFICGDHYLLLSVDDMRELHSDIRTDLVNLTQSALPWLCQGRPIPGLGKTIDELRPDNTVTPTPSHPPTTQPHTP